MRGLLAVHTLLYALLIAADAAATPVRDGLLGAPCSNDTDCDDGSGLFCFLASSELGSSGPAGGLCSTSCYQDADCESVSQTAACFGSFCVEGCVQNSSFESTFDPGKCHGREDMACYRGGPADYASDIYLFKPACAPRCASDDQCGVGLHCNRATGLCDIEAPQGQERGTACEVDPQRSDEASLADPCEGICLVGFCIEPCTIGASNACTPRADAPIGYVCLSSLSGYATGDLGACVELCNCSSDCPDGMLCEPWELDQRYEAAGACTPGAPPTGAPDCLDDWGDEQRQQCAQGSIRACRTDACLGTATCLATGDYGQCECISDSSDAANDAGNWREAKLGRPAASDGDANRDAAPVDADGGPVGRARKGASCSSSGAPSSHGRPVLPASALLVLLLLAARSRRSNVTGDKREAGLNERDPDRSGAVHLRREGTS